MYLKNSFSSLYHFTEYRLPPCRSYSQLRVTGSVMLVVAGIFKLNIFKLRAPAEKKVTDL